MDKGASFGPGSIGSADEAQGLRPSGDDPSRGVPIIPARPAPRFDGVVAICGACRRDVHMVEGYYCPRLDCPIQMRVY